jgi:hypothetical protein
MIKRTFEEVESEIRKEKAEALGRVGERLERTLLEIEAFRREILSLAETVPHGTVGDGDRTTGEIDKRLAEHARLCEEAGQLRFSLIIQREAVGLWRHEDVDRQYPMPGRLSIPIVKPDGEER